MKSISVALAAHIAQEVTTLSKCLLFTWTDGTQLGFTDHDNDITFDAVTYYSVAGYTASDVQTTSDLNVDNLEVVGMTDTTVSHPSITEADLLAGKWDFAAYRLFAVNWVDLTMGALNLRAGKLGEVTLDRGQFKAELRGMMQAYTRSLGLVEGPGCNANLGDSRCTKDLTAFTVTGTITRVNADGLTLYDTSRSEPGPTGGFTVTGITNANPGVVTTSAAHGFVEGEAVSIYGVVGPTSLNTVTIVRSPGTTTFQLGVDTSNTTDYPAYVSGGTVTPLGGDAGYFDDGVITMTSGLNSGLSREVKSYVTGQWTLQYPFPYAVAVSDTYSMVAGCDKSLETCRDTFDNIVNFRGFPYLPGTDKIVQVGRRN